MMLLTPAEGKAIIDVDTVREAVGFARSTPSLGRWRVLLIDSADDLNTAAANALLKVLEEPGGQTLLFLVSHNAGKLLPTIRSRCVVLRCPVPDYETFADILSRHGFSATREVYDTSHGSPGIALEYLQGGLSDVLRSASAMLDHLGEHSLSEKLAFAETLAAAAKQAPAVWQALARLWLGWCHRQLRQAAVHHLPYPHVFPRWQACDALRVLLQQAPALYMDTRSVTLSALRYLERVEGRGGS
jgi:DNA polymerase-3 subunit delta'